MRVTISGIIVVLAAGLMVAPPASAADVSAPPPIEQPQVDDLTVPAVPDTSALRSAEEVPDDLVAELPGRRTGEYSLVGVTWNPGFDARGLEVQVRSRTEGTWSDWEELHVDLEEAEGGRPGTEPWWVGEADGVAARVTSPTGDRPAGLSVTTVDTGETPAAAATPAIDAQPAVDGKPSYTAKPSIISRSSWGARKNTYCDSPRTSNQTRGAVVHHTAGTNSYSKAQSASIVRGVQSYHMKARDWCDIGYNFLVDKYGQIFEGRNGGVDLPVRGAHAGTKPVNEYTMGVSMMGTYSSSEPTVATKDAMVKLIGWRFGTTYHPAEGKVSIDGDSYNRISVHRDVVSTECPGAKAVDWVRRDTGGLRKRVAAYISGYASASKNRVAQLGSSLTGPVYVGEYPFSQAGGGRKVRLAKLDVYSTSAGAFYVGTTVRAEYAHFRSQAGGFGVPISERGRTANPAVSVQQFAHGSVWQAVRSGKTTAYGIWGPLDAEYRTMGGPTSSLGSPVRRYASLGGGVYRAYFSLGTLTREADGTFTVDLK